MISVTSQKQLDKALTENPDAEVTLIKGSFSLTLSGTAAPLLIVLAAATLDLSAWGSSRPRVVARESSQPRVEAWGSSQPRVEAWESSQPRVEAWGSSQPRVEAWGSSQPRVVARESSQPRVVARESSQPRVEAWGSSQPRVEARGSSQPRVVARESSQPRVVARESSQPRVEAWGSSQPRVEARGSSQPRVVAWESSQPRVEAWGSSQPRVVAWGSSQPRVVAWESSQPRVEAWGSSQPRVEARGSSQPRVVAWESSQPRVEAWGSSQPRVVAWESSQPRVEARGYAQLSAKGAVTGTAAATVAVCVEGAAKINGGHQTVVRRSTPEEWCAYYGVSVTDGVALVYKGVLDTWRSPHGADYTPGTVPVALDWDGGRRECGAGLHFSPTPRMTHAFISEPAHYLACPIRLEDIAVHADGAYPEKIKARGCCAPVYEVDEDGEPVSPVAQAEATDAP